MVARVTLWAVLLGAVALLVVPAVAQVPAAWTYQLPEELMSLVSVPVAGGSAVVAGTSGFSIVALNGTTGQLVWTRTEGPWGTLVAYKNLIIASNGVAVFAFDAATGARRWMTAVPNTVNVSMAASPAVTQAGEYVTFAAAGAVVLRFKVSSGSMLSSLPIGWTNATGPFLAFATPDAGKYVVACYYDVNCGFALYDGAQLKWSRTDANATTIQNPPVFIDSTMSYSGGNSPVNAFVESVNVVDGSTRWTSWLYGYQIWTGLQQGVAHADRIVVFTNTAPQTFTTTYAMSMSLANGTILDQDRTSQTAPFVLGNSMAMNPAQPAVSFFAWGGYTQVNFAPRLSDLINISSPLQNSTMFAGNVYHHGVFAAPYTFVFSDSTGLTQGIQIMTN